MAQLVERDLAKVEAAGSSPVSRSCQECGSAGKYGISIFYIMRCLMVFCVKISVQCLQLIGIICLCVPGFLHDLLKYYDTRWLFDVLGGTGI